MQEENKVKKVGGFFSLLFNKVVNLIIFLVIIVLIGGIVWFWNQNSLKKIENENLQKDIKELKENLQNEKNVRSKLDEIKKVDNKPNLNENYNRGVEGEGDLICPMIGRECNDGKSATYKPNSCDLVCPEDENSQNQNNQNSNSNCAKEGEKFSSVYKDYAKNCCAGLTEWNSGMDTRISVADKCYETGMLAGSPVGTCINCGDGKCSENESVCNCSKDCGTENSKYRKIEDFCFSDDFAKICKKSFVSKQSEELCNLCK